MTLTKLDNLFNILAQELTEINYYHFGWITDVNEKRNINNNFTNNEGVINYPAVYFEVPDIKYNYSSKTDTFDCVLYFVTPKRTDQDTGQDENTNLSEYWTELYNIAKKFVTVFNEAGKGIFRPVIDFEIELSDDEDNKGTIYVICKFTIVNNNNCVDITGVDTSAIKGLFAAASDTDSIENNN